MTPDQRHNFEQAVTGTFMWSFKKGDNIVYNYEMLWELYSAKHAVSEKYKKRLYNKPITLIIASIIECILDDFVIRIIGHVNDIVPNMTRLQIDNFKTTKRDRFEHYIAAAQKHNLFDANDYFYDELTFLKNSRNRFHIQNSRGYAPADEANLFTEVSLVRAERVFEFVIRKMMTKYYRGAGPKIKTTEVPYPWKIS